MKKNLLMLKIYYLDYSINRIIEIKGKVKI